MDRIPYVSKLHNILLRKLKIRRLQDLVVDSYTRVRDHQSGFPTVVWETLKYRLAGIKVPVTRNERRLLELRNQHKGQRAFIIGNGPSLNKCDLSLLKNEITFGVNAIYLNYEKMDFFPTYYIVEDVFVAEDRADEINSFKGPVKFFGNYLNYCLKNSDDVVWINVQVDYRNYPGFPNFSTNAARKLWVGGTVSYLCLQLAYFMGFSEIYLVGFDHTYKIPEDAQVNGVDIVSRSNDPNHFIPSYFGEGYRWHDPNVDRMEKALLKAKNVFLLQEKNIYNATVGGYLEVFERVEFSCLFR